MGAGFHHPWRHMMRGVFGQLHGSGRCHRRWLARGSSGDAVRQLQEALGVPADSHFGPQTEEAVKKFQAAQGLPVDGLVGPRTRAKLFPAEAAEKCEQKKETPQPEKKESEAEKPVLLFGSTGEAVKELQYALGIVADGSFWRGTDRAVREFQQAHNLPVDGVVGQRTWAALKEKTDSAMKTLIVMGFADVETNARLLHKHHGNVEAVVAEILGSQH